MKLLFCIIVMTGLVQFSANAQGKEADAIIGTWLNESGTTGFEIYKEKNKYYAKIAWLAQPTVDGEERKDQNNPDPEKRNNPLIGTEIITAFVYKNEEWKGERLYNPKSGKTFHAYLALENKDKLAVTGYKRARWLGKTQHWFRSDMAEDK